MSTIERCRKRLRHGEEDEGFTLIELLVVLLIIGILLAIAIPTFLSITKGANGTTAQSNLSTALTAATGYYTDGGQSYSGIMGVPTGQTQTYSDLQEMGLGMSLVAGTDSSSASNVVSVESPAANDYQVVALAAYAPGQNDCWGIVDIKSTQTSGNAVDGETAVGTYYGVAHGSSTTTCTAEKILGLTTVQSQKFPGA